MVSAKGLGSHLKTRVVAEISKEVGFPIKGSIPFASLEKRLIRRIRKVGAFRVETFVCPFCFKSSAIHIIGTGSLVEAMKRLPTAPSAVRAAT